MSASHKLLQVFIASPNDLVEERKAINEVSASLNAIFGRQVGIQIQLLGWEDRLPGFGRPQELINEDVDKADLFVGFLWRRWGSESGNSQYTSGFEEEFKRSLERREKTGAPEIALFFKAIEKESLADPGPQLQRVREFHQWVVESKKILFRNFSDLGDWKEQTRELLTHHLLRLIGTAPSQERTQAPAFTVSTPRAGIGASSGQDSIVGQSQAVGVIEKALESVNAGELSSNASSDVMDAKTVARFVFLAASFANREIATEWPGVHSVNLLYKHHGDFQLTRLERRLALRLNLASEDENMPSWYWLKNQLPNVGKALIFLASYDGDFFVRRAAMNYIRKLKISLRTRWTAQQPLNVMSSHSETDVRSFAIQYLTDSGTKMDIKLVESLLSDSDPTVRNKAKIAQAAISMRIDTSSFFEDTLLTSAWIADETLMHLEQHNRKLSVSQLKRALSHPDTKVQRFAAKILIHRREMDLNELKRLQEIDRSSELREEFFLSEISNGKRFSPSEIKSALQTDLWGSEPTSYRSIVSALFALYDFDELQTKVDALDRDSSIAYEVLAKRHYNRFSERLRQDLVEDFFSFKGRRSSTDPDRSRSLLFSITSDIPDIVEFTTAALEAISLHGDESFRNLVLQFIDNKSDSIRIAALACMGRVGTASDVDLLLTIAEGERGDIGTIAARSALALAPGAFGAAAKLLRTNVPELVKMALQSVVDCDYRSVWPQIEKRVHDDDEEIRKLICAYALKRLPSASLVRLLNSCLARDTYYYNVVFWLDRAIYAKQPLRKCFRAELESVLD